MKKTCTLVMLALGITMLFACKKNKDNNNDNNNDLVSTWELAEASSAMLPKKTFDPGNGNTLRINEGGTFAYSRDGQVTQQGTYTIVADGSVEEEVCLVNLKDKYRNRFNVTSVDPVVPGAAAIPKIFFYVENNRLYMISGCYAVDAGALLVYRRANPVAID